MTGAAQRWVVFDLGGTLVDETESWDRWSDHLAVPRLTFAAFGAVASTRRLHHPDVFGLFQPGSRLEDEAPRRAAARTTVQTSPCAHPRPTRSA